MIRVVTIDGPSGSGKGTISQMLAERLGWRFLDSGALYRVLGVAALRRGLGVSQPQKLKKLTEEIDVIFSKERIILSGEDVTDTVRTESAGSMASKLAALPEVRQALLARQRAFRLTPGLVADGRDMGTVVFPDAPAKVFLEASPEERAKRRYKQLKEKGIGASLPSLTKEIAERDARDRARSVSPLKAAKDAVIIDTTALSIDAVVDRVMEVLDRQVRGG